jgi:hypothetical protein
MAIDVPALTEPQASFVIFDNITLIVNVSTAYTFRAERESFATGLSSSRMPHVLLR